MMWYRNITYGILYGNPRVKTLVAATRSAAHGVISSLRTPVLTGWHSLRATTPRFDRRVFLVARVFRKNSPHSRENEGAELGPELTTGFADFMLAAIGGTWRHCPDAKAPAFGCIAKS